MIPLFIPYVNRPDLLEKSWDSVYDSDVDAIVIDNSPTNIRLDETISYGIRHSTYRAPVPLTFSQTQNWIMQLAIERSNPFYLFMHSDAEAGEGTVDKLVAMAQSLTEEGRKWAVAFTAYDALVAFNTEAFRQVEGWDTALEWYASDCDMYRRLKLAGYELVESGLPVKHEPSQTLNADPEIRRKVDLMFPYRQSYYRAKHGGDPGHETYLTPFNR